MLPVNQVEALILQLATPLQAQETIVLDQAYGRILANSVTSQLDFPHWDNSSMDGYAVRFADVATCSPDHPVTLQIMEEIPAGVKPKLQIQTGQAARILTGAMMPIGADTVIMQENTQRQGDTVSILAAPPAIGHFVRQKGSFYRAGHPLLPIGTRILAPELAVLAAAQCTKLQVYRLPQVALFSTGSELVTPDQPLQAGQIVDSNQYALTALVTQSGAQPRSLGIIPDIPEQIEATIAQAISSADIVISSGGVSVGDYDYIDDILARLGATIHSRAVAIRPGKPLTIATFQVADRATPVLYFGLPGNPVSALVTFWRFVQPAIRKIAGWPQGWQPMFLPAIAGHELLGDRKREAYLWGSLENSHDGLVFHQATGSHSSGNLINLAHTNALAVLPVGQTLVATGSPVQVMLVGARL